MTVNVEIKPFYGEKPESFLKRFKKRVMKEKILDDVRKHSQFEKKSDKKRREKNRDTFYVKKREKKKEYDERHKR